MRSTRLLFTIAGKTIHDVGQLHFDELHGFLGKVKPTGRGADAGLQVLREIRGRLELLLGIGLDYLNFNRRSGTLSGGESQRIRLSTQIGSGLMGMLYVLDGVTGRIFSGIKLDAPAIGAPFPFTIDGTAVVAMSLDGGALDLRDINGKLVRGIKLNAAITTAPLVVAGSDKSVLLPT